MVHEDGPCIENGDCQRRVSIDAAAALKLFEMAAEAPENFREGRNDAAFDCALDLKPAMCEAWAFKKGKL